MHHGLLCLRGWGWCPSHSSVLIPQLSAGCLCPEHTRSSLLRSQGASSSCQTFAGQHEGMEAKLLPSCLWSGRIRVLLGMREWREGACSVQATATAGRREEDGGSLGGRRGDRKGDDTTTAAERFGGGRW